jgi:hypothetical protein
LGIETLRRWDSPFNYGTEDSHAHDQPGGLYHYHGMPEAFMAKLNNGKAMTLIDWAGDGFPIYARYGYTVATMQARPSKSSLATTT